MTLTNSAGDAVQTLDSDDPLERRDFWPRRVRRRAFHPPLVRFSVAAKEEVERRLDQAIQLAIQCQREGRWADAERVYREMLLLHPRDPSVLHGLGQVLHLQKQSEAAIEFLRWAVAEIPDCVEFRIDSAAALASMERYEEAERELVIALQFKPDCMAGWRRLGDLLEAQGKLHEAIKSYRKAIKCLSSPDP